MMDLTSINDLMCEKTGHGDNALLDTRDTGRSIKLYLSQCVRFPKMWYFDKCRLRRFCAASFYS